MLVSSHRVVTRLGMLAVLGTTLAAVAPQTVLAQALPLGSEPEAVEIFKRAGNSLAQELNVQFVYDDRCAPRVTPAEERAQRQARGLPEPTPGPVPPPTKVFDNFYYVGVDEVSSWALVTDRETVLFDTLNNEDEARDVIVGGMKKLGLDPAKITKVYVMHGHGDHYGGAKYLQSNLSAKILMGAADWPGVEAEDKKPNGEWTGRSPKRDGDIVDGQTESLGTNQIRFFETPGHTPGTVSALITLTYRGEPHVAAFWGGTGYPRDKKLLTQYIDSLTRFTSEARKAGADIFLSNHSHTDGAVEKIAKINFEAPKNPMIGGKDYVVKLLDLINVCARAQLAR